MRNLVIGAVVGLVVGVVVGTTVVAPRLKLPNRADAAAITTAEQAPLGDTADAVARLAPSGSLLPAHGPQQLRWRLASAYASSLPQLGGLGKRLEQTVWRMSGGNVRIAFHEPGALIAPDELVEAVRSGAVDAGFAAPALWAGKNPALLLFSGIPFGPPAQEYLSWIFVGGGRQILEEISHRIGIHPLVCGALAPEGSGWFRERITGLDKFRKLRLGMTGLGGAVAEKLGAQVTELAEGDVFVALESGLIDGAEASQPSVDLKLGLHRLASHYYFPGWHQPATLLTLIVGLDTWQGLAPSHRALIEAACGDNVRHGMAEGEARQFSALKELVKQGVTIETWSPEILDAMRAAWTEVAGEQVKKNKDFKRAWERLTAFRDEYGIWREIGDGSPPVR